MKDSLPELLYHEQLPPDADPDLATLGAMRASGADMDRETETRFFLYFPAEAKARTAALICSREGYDADVHPPMPGSDQWLCLLTCEMRPTGDALHRARVRFEALATSLGGDYDGWEAAIDLDFDRRGDQRH